MKKINLAFVLHCHQPIGNMDYIFEENYNNAFKPFIEVLKKHPHIKISLHYNGILLEWFELNHPEFLNTVIGLIKIGQIEILSGAFYEPILAVIPDQDKAGQINKMNSYISKLLINKPHGMWLTEKIWEPHLASMIANCNLEYTCLDDTQIWASGVTGNINGYYLTEECGEILKIVPINTKLKYLIPYGSIEETIEYIESCANETTDPMIVFGDAGEKFGSWPTSYSHVYTEGYLDKFFTAIEKSTVIESTLLNEYINSHEPSGKIYIPASAYNEMMEWALPSDMEEKYQVAIHKILNGDIPMEFKQFFRGGIWRNFFVKYPESNNMHKKMLYVSDKVRNLNDPDAMDLLWSGQANLAYWHGIYGGLYLNHLRHEIYKRLIKAEYLADYTNFKTKYWLVAEKYDFDKDLHREILVNSNLLNVYITTQNGGTIYELDYKPAATNLVDVLSRRYEPYHKQLKKGNYILMSSITSKNLRHLPETIIAKEEGIEDSLHYDKYRRLLLVDHFIDPNTSAEDFRDANYVELGDFIETRYESSIIELTDKIVIKLFRLGSVNNKKIKLEKKIVIYRNSSKIDISYNIKNIDEDIVELCFAPELNFNLMSGDSDDRYYIINNQMLERSNLVFTGINYDVDVVSLIDEIQKLQINISFENQPRIIRCPVETVSQAQDGFEKIYQGSTILPMWDFKISPGKNYRVQFSQSIASLDGYSVCE